MLVRKRVFHPKLTDEAKNAVKTAGFTYVSHKLFRRANQPVIACRKILRQPAIGFSVPYIEF